MSAQCGHGHSHGHAHGLELDLSKDGDLAVWLALKDRLNPDRFLPNAFQHHLEKVLSTSLSFSPTAQDLQKGQKDKWGITLYARFAMDPENGAFHVSSHDRGSLGHLGKVVCEKNAAGRFRVSVFPLTVDTSEQGMQALQQLDLFRKEGREITEIKKPDIFSFPTQREAMDFMVAWLAAKIPQFSGYIAKSYEDAQAKVERGKMLDTALKAPGTLFSFLRQQFGSAFKGPQHDAHIHEPRGHHHGHHHGHACTHNHHLHPAE